MSTPRLDPSLGTLLRAGSGFRLADIDPGSTPGFDGRKRHGRELLADALAELGDLQERLFASSLFGGTRSVLLVLQAMDTAGKGGIVRHVMGGMDPQGVHVRAFKAPTDQEKAHDFLWRIRPELPRPGYICVFDRSHYEDVLIHRVLRLSSPEAIEERYDLINAFEADVAASGTTIVKVMLHISADEQAERLRERLDRPEKHWKYSTGDLDSRDDWAAYQEAYQVAIERTSTTVAPWFVVPANRKFYARVAVQRLILDALEGFGLGWPAATYDVDEQKVRLAQSLPALRGPS
ncbi:MAG: polyphosphate kinase 2 family protein [Burkholderiaceae bacterium]|nr:polyphosphate kinase 2 family protein [Microbacteriaceae bacterium]